MAKERADLAAEEERRRHEERMARLVAKEVLAQWSKSWQVMN